MASLSFASSPPTTLPPQVPTPSAHTPTAARFVSPKPCSFATSISFTTPNPRHLCPVAMLTPQSSSVASKPDIGDEIAKSVKEAQELCAADESSGECAAAWDTVEEISSTAARKRVAQQNEDPLEKYCKEVPESEECKVYDN